MQNSTYPLASIALDHTRWLFDFHDWARLRVLRACKQLGEKDLMRPGIIPGGNEDGSLHATLAHILGAEVIWFERWQGRVDARLPGSSDYPRLDALEEAWSKLEITRRRWLAELSESALNRKVKYMSVTRGVIEQFPLWQTRLHLSNHSTHHRGEAAAALSGLRCPPESVDLVDFMRHLQDVGAESSFEPEG
jgi:uncharacterized damage-inducible protein DinB